MTGEADARDADMLAHCMRASGEQLLVREI
jgi:hypothetical protein